MFYHQDARREPEKYWVEIGKKHYSALKSALHADDQIQSAAAQAIEGAKIDEEKTVAHIGRGFPVAHRHGRRIEHAVRGHGRCRWPGSPPGVRRQPQ